MADFDRNNAGQRVAMERAMDALGDLSEDSRLDGAERDEISHVRQIIDELLEGQR